MNRVNFTGEQIGPYYVRECIGQGGMADVYRAYQPSVKREVALKVIPLIAHAGHEQLQQRFTQEAEMIAALEHPHILPVFDYGISTDVLYLAMRLLRGGTLGDLLDREVMPISRTADLLEQVAAALGYAHRRGVIHRDMKPSNILLDDEGNAYLADFGLAKVLGGSPHLTTTGSVVGTPAYMSPEQLRGDPIDQRSDIYSLGVILYHMVAGRPPFEALTTFSLIYQHVEKEPPPPQEFNPQITPAVEAVVLRALRKNSAERFDSAEQMAEAFAAALGRRESLGGKPVLLSLPGSVAVQSATPAPPAQASASARPALSIPEAGSHAAGRRARRRLWLVLPVLIVLGVFFAFLVAQQNVTPVVPSPTVLMGQRGTANSVTPSEAEVAAARRQLGTGGFVAYVVCNMQSQFFALQARSMSDIASQYGLGYRVYDSETDPNRQIIQIERARMEGARALIVCVVDAETVDETLESASEAGLPLVLQNVSEPPSYSGVLVMVDDYELGLKAGQYAGQVVAEELGGQARVIILDFPDLPAIVTRANGLQDGLLEYAPQATMVGRYRGGTAEFAEESVRSLLEDGVHFDVILSINDAGAYGAIAALEEAGVTPDSVIITGIDAEALARQYIREGHFMRASVGVAGAETSHASMNAVVKLLSGSTVPQILVVPPGELVTRAALLEQE